VYVASRGSPTASRCAACGRGGRTIWPTARLIEPRVDKGTVFAIAPEILFRSQPHGAYKLFFNGLYLSVAPDLLRQEAGSR